MSACCVFLHMVSKDPALNLTLLRSATEAYTFQLTVEIIVTKILLRTGVLTLHQGKYVLHPFCC